MTAVLRRSIESAENMVLNLLLSLKARRESFADPWKETSRNICFFDQSKPLGACSEYDVEHASYGVKSGLTQRYAPDF